MRLTEFADPEVYSLAARDAAELLDQIERLYPGGMSADASQLLVRLTKQPSNGRRKLLDGL
jgi:hypothetical protein